MELKKTDEEGKKKYKYHYMDSNKEQIFRYDNAKHHHEIKTFPHHKYVGDKIEESEEPELIDVLTEIQDKIKNDKDE